VLDGDQVYIVGAGVNGKGVLCFDMASGVWNTLGATSSSKFVCKTFVFGGCLYVAGGADNYLISDTSSGVERYTVATDTWTAVANMLENRSNSCAVTCGSTDLAEG
jgi:hypothetical protein